MSSSNLYYHGNVSRDNCSKILERNMDDGTFLIRDCTSTSGDYVLSLCTSNQVLHFQIHSYGDINFGIQDGPIFHGLDTLVGYYKSSSDGLPNKIANACPGGFGAPLHTLKYAYDTSLHKASTDGDIESVKELLTDKEVLKNIDARNLEGYTALHLSCAVGDDEIVKLILQAGCNVSALDAMNRSAILIVCMAGYSSTLRLLVEQGKADIHERNVCNGHLPLHISSERGFLDCVKILLSFNASLLPRTYEGDTPRDLASKNNHTDVVKYLDNFSIPSPSTTESKWLHQNVDRYTALKMLHESSSQPGSFLVRTSAQCNGCYVLSLLGSKKKIHHYKIQTKGDCWFFIDDGPFFDSLPCLVEHYMKFADGLPTSLSKPISPIRRKMPLPPAPFGSAESSRISEEESNENFSRIGRLQRNATSLSLSHLSLGDSVKRNSIILITR